MLSEFIGGYLFAGKPLANMIFKILSEDVVSQGIFFAQDQKLGHYFKVAPRTVFFAQGFAVLLGSLTQAGVTIWMLGNIENVCSLDQADNFTCPNGRTVYSSSVIWGLIGPARLYSVGKIYSGLLHFFLDWCDYSHNHMGGLEIHGQRILPPYQLASSVRWDIQRPAGNRKA